MALRAPVHPERPTHGPHDGATVAPDASGGDTPWMFTASDGPIIAAAIHAGHDLPPAVSRIQLLDSGTRRREEDPYIDGWATVAHRSIVVHRSRFHFDLDRPRDCTVYRGPTDAWGLEVWREPLPQEEHEGALALHSAFYAELTGFLDTALEVHPRLVVLDLHAYNHRRGGPDAPAAEPVLNPEINIGLGSVDMERWGDLIRRFVGDLKAFMGPDGRKLDVRSNIKFRGGHFPTWINRRYARRVCAVGVEVKKTFMDEWSGQLFPERFEVIRDAILSTTPGLTAELAPSHAAPAKLGRIAGRTGVATKGEPGS
jgi:N-formylglutamate deformylase